MNHQYEPISEKEIKAISNDYYIARVYHTKAVDRPKVILVAAQPGAGKTTAAKLVKNELKQRGGYIHIDADRMREQLSTGGVSYPSEQTQGDAGRLVSALREQVITDKRNFLEEGTFRNSESVQRFVSVLKNQGYQVEIVAVSANSEQSLSGIYERYEGQIQADSTNPRLVSAQYHQEAYDGFTKMFRENTDLFDRVRVFSRAGQELFDSHKSDNTQTAYGALLSGRKMSIQDWQEIQTAWESVIESAKQRGNATEQYMADITAHKNRVSAALRAEKFKPEGMTEKPQTAKADKQRIKSKNHL